MSEAPTSSNPVDPQKLLARELWQRLAKSRPGPSTEELIYLARFVPLLSKSAIKTLAGRKLSLSELKELIQYVPKAKDIAIKMALKLGADALGEEDMRFLFTQSKAPEIGKALLKKYPNDANIGLVERTTDELAEYIGKMKEQEPTKTVLREIDRKL
ncbi:MAG: hypothetical protein ABJZ55_05500 [Fuerstiella sp.]